MSKDDSEKKPLILKFYNHMVRGKGLIWLMYLDLLFRLLRTNFVQYLMHFQLLIHRLRFQSSEVKLSSELKYSFEKIVK